MNVQEFHTTCHPLPWSPGVGVIMSLSHVHHIDILMASIDDEPPIISPALLSTQFQILLSVKRLRFRSVVSYFKLFHRVSSWDYILLVNTFYEICLGI